MTDNHLQMRAAVSWQEDLQRLMQSEGASRSLVAALAFLVWDILITIDEETAHVWMTKFQPLKLLYSFTRYYSVLALVILNTRSLSCKGWVIIESISAVLLEIVVEIMLILRIYAMYTTNRSLLYFLIPAFVVQIVIMVASLGVSLPQVRDSPQCAEVFFPVGIIAYSVSSILFEGLLFGLTLYKYYIARSEGWAHVGLLTILVRDGVWAFALLFLANVANTLFFTIAPATLAALGFPWLLAILGSVGPRLVLNIRREHKRLLPDSVDDVEIEFPTMEYSAVDTTDLDDSESEGSSFKRLSWAPRDSHRISWGSIFSLKQADLDHDDDGPEG